MWISLAQLVLELLWQGNKRQTNRHFLRRANATRRSEEMQTSHLEPRNILGECSMAASKSNFPTLFPSLSLSLSLLLFHYLALPLFFFVFLSPNATFTWPRVTFKFSLNICSPWLAVCLRLLDCASQAVLGSRCGHFSTLSQCLVFKLNNILSSAVTLNAFLKYILPSISETGF